MRPRTGTMPPQEQTGEMPTLQRPGAPPLQPGQQPSQPSMVPQQPPQQQVSRPPAYPTNPGPYVPAQAPLTGTIPVHAPVTPTAVVPAPSSSPSLQGRITVKYPQVGAVLTSMRGNYTIRTVLGSGEFGAVYEAVGPFDQTYAIKMIRPANRPYAEVHAEWQRELQRLMSLRHPNVVYMHDAFEQGNLFYLALERCDHPLTPMLGTPMQEGLAIELVRQLLAAVQFLHDNDIVHDDLHPGNVLVTHSSDRPVVKISDFGISHNLAGAPAIRPNVVHHKIMAPEVVSSGYTSKQSDLYQVGLLLYWMVAGEPAIAPGLPYQELVRVVSDGEPRQRAEAIGTPLGGLIAKMLRRRDAYRYTSAKEVWADLRELPAWQNRALFPTK